MTDQDPDLKVPQRVSQSYRELGAAEPPHALDDAILAAARREAGARPAALAARAGRQRWYAPLATAAVLVLAVAVTINMRHERPGVESPVQQAAVPPAAEKETARETAQEAAKPAIAEEMKIPRRKAAEQPTASASARSDESRGAASSVAGSLARQAEERTSRDAEAVARAPQVGPLQALAKRAEKDSAPVAAAAPPPAPAPAARAMSLRERSAELTPERELERIAELRVQGRHDEADKALADFRKRLPDYIILEEVLRRVERR